MSLGTARYFPAVILLVLVFVLGRRVYVPVGRGWYAIGCLLYLLPAGVASIAYGDTMSYAYVVFGLLNFLLYPIFERAKLTNLHLLLILVGLGITIIPLGVGNRVVSIYDNPNNYSAVVFATMYIGMLLCRGRFWLQVGVLIAFATLIYLGASRSMLGAILIFAVLYFGQAYIFKRVFGGLIVAAFVLSSFGYYSLITSDEFRMMETIQSYTPSDKAGKGLSHRDQLFSQSMGLIAERPMGYGMGMSNQALKERYDVDISPHNTFLKIGVEGGVIALAGFIILVVGFWWTTASPLAASFLFAMMVRGFFESSTPMSLSLISGMLIIPMFLNELTVTTGYRLAIFGSGADRRPNPITVH